MKYCGLIIMIILLYSCGISSKEIIKKRNSLEEVKIIDNDFYKILDSVIDKSEKCVFFQENNPCFFGLNFSKDQALKLIINSHQYTDFNCGFNFIKHNSNSCFYYRGVLFTISADDNLIETKKIFEKCGRKIYLYPIDNKEYVFNDYYQNSIGVSFLYEYINDSFVLIRESLCDENMKNRKIKETKDKIIFDISKDNVSD